MASPALTEGHNADAALARALAALSEGERRDVLLLLQATHRCADGKSPSPSALEGLCASLASAPPHAITIVGSVAIGVPLRALTATIATESTRLAAARCVTTALRRINPLETLLAISSVGSLALSLDTSATPQLAGAPAELRVAVVNAIAGIVDRLTPQCWVVLQNDDHLPVLGHLISVLLAHGTEESVGTTPIPRNLRTVALGVLRAVVAGVPSPSRLATFLPGVASALGRVATGDFKQGLAVFEAAVTCWGEVVAKVMSDSNRHAAGSDSGGGGVGVGVGGVDDTDNSHDNDEEDSRRLIARQDDAWWSDTANNLKVMVEKVVRVGRHESWRVRLATVGMASAVLLRCTHTMVFAAPTLIELLVELADDEVADVARAAVLTLGTYSRVVTSQECTRGRRTADGTDRGRGDGVDHGGAIGGDSNRADISDRRGDSATRDDDDEMSTVAMLCEENLLALLSELPRLARSASDDELVRATALLASYAALLGPRVKALFMQSRNVRRLNTAAVQLLELDSSDVKLIAERLHGPSDGAATVAEAALAADAAADTARRAAPWRRFKWFRSTRVYDNIARAFRLIGRHGDVRGVADQLARAHRTTPAARPQLALVLAELVAGACGAQDARDIAWGARAILTQGGIETEVDGEDGKREGVDDTVEDVVPHHMPSVDVDGVVRMAVVCLTDDAVWQLPTHMGPSSDASHDVAGSGGTSLLLREPDRRGAAEFTCNALTLCASMSAVGTLAEATRNSFRPLLILALYPVVDMVGSDTAVVAHTALGTLERVRRALGYVTVSDMVCDNSDYLVNAVSMNLRYLDMNPRAPRALRSMLDVCDAQIFPYLRDTIDEVFDALDGYQEERLPDFLRILESLVRSFHRWDIAATTPPEDDDAKSEGRGDGGDDKEGHGQQGNYGNNVASPSAEGTPSSLDWRDVVVRVLDRCAHLAHATAPRVRLLVIDIVCAAVTALQLHDDHLLPAINGFWPPLVGLLDDSEVVVRTRTMEAICVVIAAAPGFMGSRVTADIIPALLARADASTLRVSPSRGKSDLDSADTSTMSSSLLRFSAGFRHERALLRLFLAVLPSSDVADEKGAALAEACLPYLASHIPDQLQRDAISVFEALTDRDPDGIWLVLATACAPTIPSAPDARFPAPQFPPPMLSCRANVDALLERIERAMPPPVVLPTTVPEW